MCLAQLFVRKQTPKLMISKANLFNLVSSADTIKLSDKFYKLVDISRLKKFLKYNRVDKLIYKKDKMDCDDFAVILNGDVTRWDSDLCFGEVWLHKPDGEYHAMNIAVTLDYEVVLVEPQTDEIITDLTGYVFDFVKI